MIDKKAFRYERIETESQFCMEKENAIWIKLK